MIRPRSMQKLQDAMQDLEREVAVRTEALAQLKMHVQQLRELIAFVSATADDGAGASPLSTQPRSRMQPTKVARNALFEILREASGPKHSRDLLKQLQERGVEIGGKDPANNVRSYLSHDTRFVSCGQGLWGLRSRANGMRPASSPHPEVGSPLSDSAASPRIVVAEPDPMEPPPDPSLDDGDPADDWNIAEKEANLIPF
jgi:hypothetical protein